MAVAERESDYYDSAYLADYYESLWTDHPALEDSTIYWSIVRPQIMSKHRANAEMVLLDVGTGTGRVIHSLIDRISNDAEVSLNAIEFIGVDKSPFMLDHARQAKQLPSDFNASWIVGSATALERLAPLADRPAQVHILIFAFSGINHLHQPGEVDQFFFSARRVLRLGGLALVSVCMPLLDVKSNHLENPYGEVKEVKSNRLEGILYRERETGQSVQGDLFINSLKTEVVKVRSNGSEQVLERNNHNIHLKLLSRKELEKSIAAARLEILEEKCIREEVIFVLKAVS